MEALRKSELDLEGERPLWVGDRQHVLVVQAKLRECLLEIRACRLFERRRGSIIQGTLVAGHGGPLALAEVSECTYISGSSRRSSTRRSRVSVLRTASERELLPQTGQSGRRA